MKLTMQSVGRHIAITTRGGREPAFGSLWQGETEDGIAVLVVAAVVSPLIDPLDERQAKFERDRETAMDSAQLHPEVERFPGQITL